MGLADGLPKGEAARRGAMAASVFSKIALEFQDGDVVKWAVRRYSTAPPTCKAAPLAYLASSQITLVIAHNIES